MNPEDASRPNHSFRILAGALAVAAIINLALLLLIGALISRRETLQACAPDPQPIDFIRIAPQAEEPKSPAPEKIVEAAPEQLPGPERPVPDPVKPSVRKPPERPQQPNRPGAAKKSGSAKSTGPGVAAPRIDIPEQGTGAPFAPVPGADSRLTAPPSQWNLKKTPETGEGQGGQGGTGGGGGLGGRNLVVLHRVPPRYPSRAEARGIEGWVRLEITVSPTGTVRDARVVDASPKGVFDRAALEAIRQWRFKPAFREGRAVEQQAEQTVRFRLKRQR
ncbi:energy transducer TonB [Methylobacter sp. BlB1]|uniref:energy transducer TonB n=1 Tax=Methylobacter sp. BlB1 TaxID=2785914 RepID=UPI0018940835|nr:energy transducer TonB [Methylobacter sp. BlB1]MBF6649733.1 energy transducer TonB [Methylobacter sp. BlB1]